VRAKHSFIKTKPQNIFLEATSRFNTNMEIQTEGAFLVFFCLICSFCISHFFLFFCFVLFCFVLFRFVLLVTKDAHQITDPALETIELCGCRTITDAGVPEEKLLGRLLKIRVNGGGVVGCVMLYRCPLSFSFLWFFKAMSTRIML